MNTVPSTNIIAKFPNTHAMKYNNQSYPFNLKIFNHFTDYFQRNQDQILPDNTIIIGNEENIELSSNSICTFIDFCQFRESKIFNDDVLSLYYLSKKFDVKDLIKHINQHVFQHQNELIIQFLLSDQIDDQQEKIEYETKISQNLSNYIDNDLLLQLPIPVLYRILSGAQNLEQTQIESFLLKILSKVDRKASVLFSVIDTEKVSFEFTNKLSNEFSNVFDFHFINSAFMKSNNDQISELIRKNKEMNDEIVKLKKLIIQKDEELNQIKNQAPSLYFKYEGENQAFNVIICYLSFSCGGNVHENGVVNVSHSSIFNNTNNYLSKYAVD